MNTAKISNTTVKKTPIAKPANLNLNSLAASGTWLKRMHAGRTELADFVSPGDLSMWAKTYTMASGVIGYMTPTIEETYTYEDENHSDVEKTRKVYVAWDKVPRERKAEIFTRLNSLSPALKHDFEDHWMSDCIAMATINNKNGNIRRSKS